MIITINNSKKESTYNKLCLVLIILNIIATSYVLTIRSLNDPEFVLANQGATERVSVEHKDVVINEKEKINNQATKKEFEFKVPIPSIKKEHSIDRPVQKQVNKEVYNLVSSNELLNIKRVYGKYATKQLIGDIDWLYSESLKRGLNPSLVFAVQAKESAWGKSWYCNNHHNCFGYGYTDSGKVGNYDGGNYREVTTKILNAYVRNGYGKTTAQDMADRGYNFHKEWVRVVNEIESYFN